MLNAGYFTGLGKRPTGQILNCLDWVLCNGPAKWCDDITYNDSLTLTQLFITGNDIIISETKTLTLTQFRPLVMIANSITVNGTITASGKGCDGGPFDAAGYRYTGVEWPFEALALQESSQTRNYCLCGSGAGGSYTASPGGGAWGAGGAGGTAAQNGPGTDCGLTDAQVKELLFSPLFNIFQLGSGGGGGGGYSSLTGGDGGGAILLIAKIITVASTGSILSNGLAGTNHTDNPSAGGGGGFVGLIGDTVSVHLSATVTATGGAGATDTQDGSNNTEKGGDGIAIEIEV